MDKHLPLKELKEKYAGFEEEKFYNDKYSVIDNIYAVKGITTDNKIELIIKFKHTGNEICRIWRPKNYVFGERTSRSRTGGKPSSVYIDIVEINKILKEKQAEPEIMGYIFLLLNNVSWHTGILKHHDASKKRGFGKPLVFDDFINIFNKSRKKTAEIIGKLKEYGILLHDKDGYKISRNFIRKGGAKREQ